MDFDPKKNYYEILGIPETASAEDAKKAFKKLAVKHHPDRGGDKAKFQEINEAYQVIGDEGKKSQYDSYRKGGFGGFGEGGFGRGGFGGADFGQGGFNVDFGDIFGSIFGGGGFGDSDGGRQKNFSGEDIQIAISISFEESFLGVSKKVSYQKYVKIDGIQESTCTTCHGKGRVAKRVQTPFGIMQSQGACDTCSGLGKIFTKDGREVETPYEKQKDIIEVKIPEAINDGVYIKFTGKGNEGLDGNNGDLYIKINITPSSLYERKGDNLYIKVKVSIFDLVLGGEQEINHPEGKLKIKIPKGTQIGDMVKISAKGFGKSGLFGKRGDLCIIPKLEIPKKLSKEEEKLWSQLKDIK